MTKYYIGLDVHSRFNLENPSGVVGTSPCAITLPLSSSIRNVLCSFRCVSRAT
jgi:hypothetical protein